jgi:hypothetical protein
MPFFTLQNYSFLLYLEEFRCFEIFHMGFSTLKYSEIKYITKFPKVHRVIFEMRDFEIHHYSLCNVPEKRNSHILK